MRLRAKRALMAQIGTLRRAAQKIGTLAWGLEIIRAHGFDRRADVTIETSELASTEAVGPARPLAPGAFYGAGQGE
jgi:hypothetical protein